MAGQPYKLRGWRRVANAMWDIANDPQIYGALEIDATEAKKFLETCKERGKKVTPTHLVGRAVGLLLRDVPELNVRIRGAYAIPRDSIDVFFMTAVEGGKDLTGVKIDRVDEISAVALADALTEKSTRVKTGRDPEFAKTKALMDALPMWLLRIVLRLTAWITGDLGLGVRALGLARTPFGSAAVTSVGMFGIPMGFAPLSQISRIPLLVLVGAIVDKPVAIDGRVEIRPILPITATIDHRFVDGFHLGRAMKTFRAYLESPATYEADV